MLLHLVLISGKKMADASA